MENGDIRVVLVRSAHRNWKEELIGEGFRPMARKHQVTLRNLHEFTISPDMDWGIVDQDGRRIIFSERTLNPDQTTDDTLKWYSDHKDSLEKGELVSEILRRLGFLRQRDFTGVNKIIVVYPTSNFTSEFLIDIVCEAAGIAYHVIPDLDNLIELYNGEDMTPHHAILRHYGCWEQDAEPDIFWRKGKFFCRKYNIGEGGWYLGAFMLAAAAMFTADREGKLGVKK